MEGLFAMLLILFLSLEFYFGSLFETNINNAKNTYFY